MLLHRPDSVCATNKQSPASSCLLYETCHFYSLLGLDFGVQTAWRQETSSDKYRTKPLCLHCWDSAEGSRTIGPEVRMNEGSASESSWLLKAVRRHLTMKCPFPSTASFQGPLLAEATVLPGRRPVGCATDSEAAVLHGWLSAPAPPQRCQRRRVIFLHFSATRLKKPSVGCRRVRSVYNRRPIS